MASRDKNKIKNALGLTPKDDETVHARGPSDDFEDLDAGDLTRYGGDVEYGAVAAGETSDIPVTHPAYPVEVLPPGATRAELRTPADPDFVPPPRHVPEDLSDPNRVNTLAKNYLAAALDSAKRVPNPKLTDGFRARLETFRTLVTQCIRGGVKGEAKIIALVVGALAVDGPGKIDAVVFLRQVMGQVLWTSSIDIARLRRPVKERDEQRDPPLGMRDMSDHADAIGGIAGPDTNPNREMTEADVTAAVIEVHGLLSAMADTLPDSDEEQDFLRLNSGLAYTDERVPDPAMPGGYRYEPVYDLDKAMDMQLVKNAEAIKLKEERNTARRHVQLAALSKLFA